MKKQKFIEGERERILKERLHSFMEKVNPDKHSESERKQIIKQRIQLRNDDAF